MHCSILIHNVSIVDGSGLPAFRGMVAVTGDRIVYAGPDSGRFAASRTIDGNRNLLCPGFIDMHGHSDLAVLRSGSTQPKIAQGITTEVIGNCGMGVYPFQQDSELPRLATDILGTVANRWLWTDFDTYAQQVDSSGSATNIVGLQAHAPLRLMALDGSPNRTASTDEIGRMVALLRDSYAQGAAGFSSGLYYAPAMFASHEELRALLDETARQDRLFAVHHRCEGDTVLESLREVLDLAQESGVRLQISHLKAIGRENQRHVDDMLALIDRYAARGVQVGFDQYPYTFGSTSLYSMLPPRYLKIGRDRLLSLLHDREERAQMLADMQEPDGWDSILALCGWEDVSVMHIDGHPDLTGRSFASLGSERGQDPSDVFFDLLAEGPAVAVMADVTQSEASLEHIMRHPLGCFGTDALYSSVVAHPRSTHATEHLLSRYWKERQTLPLETHIHRMSALSAARLQLRDRGTIREGFKADLVLLDPNLLSDDLHADTPIRMVMIDGTAVWDDGASTGMCGGRVIRY